MGIRVFLKPREGVKIRRPESPFNLLKDSGEFVILNRYFRRRIKDGDAEIVEQDSVEPKDLNADEINNFVEPDMGDVGADHGY